MVQHIVRIHTKFKLLRLGNPHVLDQVYIQPEQRRPLDPSQSKITYLSGRRIHQEKLSLRIRNGLVAE